MTVYCEKEGCNLSEVLKKKDSQRYNQKEREKWEGTTLNFVCLFLNALLLITIVFVGFAIIVVVMKSGDY